MKHFLFISLVGMLLCHCKQRDISTTHNSGPDCTPDSLRLTRQFPLLPIIEKQLWQQLLNAEKEKSIEEAKRIADVLNKRHPFKSEENFIALGGIRYDKQSRKFHIPAKVRHPDEGDKRHPGELETVLCSTSGRTHETLFVTEARPLHLEILLHLAGCKKTSPMSCFRLDVVIPDHPPIPCEVLIKSADSNQLTGEFLWEFTGSDFEDLYSPDQTGDFLILWRAHDSVLSMRHKHIASGEKKVMPKHHKHLPSDTAVTLVLTPRQQKSSL